MKIRDRGPTGGLAYAPERPHSGCVKDILPGDSPANILQGRRRRRLGLGKGRPVVQGLIPAIAGANTATGIDAVQFHTVVPCNPFGWRARPRWFGHYASI